MTSNNVQRSYFGPCFALHADTETTERVELDDDTFYSLRVVVVTVPSPKFYVGTKRTTWLQQLNKLVL